MAHPDRTDGAGATVASPDEPLTITLTPLQAQRMRTCLVGDLEASFADESDGPCFDDLARIDDGIAVLTRVRAVLVDLDEQIAAGGVVTYTDTRRRLDDFAESLMRFGAAPGYGSTNAERREFLHNAEAGAAIFDQLQEA